MPDCRTLNAVLVLGLLALPVHGAPVDAVDGTFDVGGYVAEDTPSLHLRLDHDQPSADGRLGGLAAGDALVGQSDRDAVLNEAVGDQSGWLGQSAWGLKGLRDPWFYGDGDFNPVFEWSGAPSMARPPFPFGRQPRGGGSHPDPNCGISNVPVPLPMPLLAAGLLVILVAARRQIPTAQR